MKATMIRATIAILVLPGIPFRHAQAGLQDRRQSPKAAVVEVVLTGAPGIDDEGSQWEIAYEFRLADEKLLWQRRSDLKGGSEKRVGDLIKEGTAKGLLRSPANRKFVFSIPFPADVQAKLRNQPRERIKISSGQMSAEDIKRLNDQENNSQVFLFYPIINIYDARLKKNFIINTARFWDYETYPDARFTIKIEIDRDGGYKVNSSLPTR